MNPKSTQNNLADKLTIFIPVHNRHYYLERAASYYHDFIKEHGFRLIISDSSNTPWEGSSNFPEYEYYYYPNGNLKKIEETITQKITSEYTVMVGDDDFLLPTGLLASLNFLLKNPDFAAAHGEFLKFNSLSGKTVNPNYGRLQFFNFLTNNYFFETASERILNFFEVENFFMLNHSVVKTKAMARAIDIQFANNKALYSYRFSDQQFALSILLEGNIKTLNCVYALRDDDRMLNKKTVPSELTPEKDFEEFIESFYVHGNIYIELLAKKDSIIRERCYFIYGMAIQKLITGRKYVAYLPHEKYKDFNFPSSNESQKEEIENIFSIIEKYRHLIPEYSNHVSSLQEHSRSSVNKNIRLFVNKIIKRLRKWKKLKSL